MCRTFPYLGETDFSLPKLMQPSRSAVIPNVRPAHPNAVFFPSAQMKNVRHKPYIPTEMRTIPARTQIAAHPIEVATSDLHRNCTNYIGTNLAVSGNQPRRSGFPSGEWRGVGEVERDSQIHLYLSDRPREDLRLTNRVSIRTESQPNKRESQKLPHRFRCISRLSDCRPSGRVPGQVPGKGSAGQVPQSGEVALAEIRKRDARVEIRLCHVVPGGQLNDAARVRGG